ncbi:MAG TPA: hypothetical protein VN034_07915 [Sphingopyxis sp.]|nr:hypothetical protein [Sphingopyxis sp.]
MKYLSMAALLAMSILGGCTAAQQSIDPDAQVPPPAHPAAVD